MQVEEESPKQYVDIARVPDKDMRPSACACRLRFVHLPKGAEQRQRAVALRPVPLGLRPGHADGGAVPTRTRVGATRERATAPHLNACLRTCGVASPEEPRGPCSSLRRVVCVVARLDHIDIWPAPCASHTVRPGHNASRAYL